MCFLLEEGVEARLGVERVWDKYVFFFFDKIAQIKREMATRKNKILDIIPCLHHR